MSKLKIAKNGCPSIKPSLTLNKFLLIIVTGTRNKIFYYPKSICNAAKYLYSLLNKLTKYISVAVPVKC